jgi:predicted DNA-binding protein
MPDGNDTSPAREQMRTVGLRITRVQDEYLDRVARRRGVPKSVYVRQLINQDMDSASASGHSPLTAA